VRTEPKGFKPVMTASKFGSAVYWQEVLKPKGVKQVESKTRANTINN
jgi:hypothetical protein